MHVWASECVCAFVSTCVQVAPLFNNDNDDGVGSNDNDNDTISFVLRRCLTCDSPHTHSHTCTREGTHTYACHLVTTVMQHAVKHTNSQKLCCFYVHFLFVYASYMLQPDVCVCEWIIVLVLSLHCTHHKFALAIFIHKNVYVTSKWVH